MDVKQHWETVYKTKEPSQVSWTQAVPQTSLHFIHSFKLNKSASIIDIGGGDSKLVDYLIDEGYTNLSVLDISAKALEKAKIRLGKKASNVEWIESDIKNYKPGKYFDIWHDRATFHFLTTTAEINSYLETARSCVSKFLAIGTFSENGPLKCSGLPVKQYNEQSLNEALQKGFDKLRCITEDHITPFNTQQNFLFCSFKRHLD